MNKKSVDLKYKDSIGLRVIIKDILYNEVLKKECNMDWLKDYGGLQKKSKWYLA